MMRALRWFLLLACLAGLAYVAWAVPLGGQTVWDRVRGVPAPSKPEMASGDPGTAGPARPGTVRLAEPGSASPSGLADKPAPPPPPTDLTTDSDRKALDQLIQDKLKAPSADGGSAAR
jgi:hypothetical protein